MYAKVNIILNKGMDLNITWEEFISDLDNPNKVKKLSEYIMGQQIKHSHML